MIVLDLSILNQKGTPMFYSDTFVNRPAFGIVGRIFISIDTKEIFRDTGIAWELVSDAGAGSSNLQQVTDNGSTTTNAITTGGYTATNLAGGGSQMLVVDNAGVFGVQAIPSSTNIYNSDGTLTAARTVSLNGHNLLFSGGASVARLRLDANNNVARIFSFATANVARWAFRVDGNETGANAGADFAIRRYNDAGTIIDAPISINRATGALTFANLAGSGTQMVVTDNNGLISKQSIPSGAQIGNVVTGGTEGSVLFIGAGGVLQQDNANFFWDNTNKRLGIGTTIPANIISIVKNQNAETGIRITNTTVGTNSYASLTFVSDTNSGQFNLFKGSTNYSTYKILTAKDAGFYNSIGGDYAFLNDWSQGKLKFAMGNASVSQMTLTAAGRLLLGLTTESTYILDVNGTSRFQNNLLVIRNGNFETNIQILNTNNSANSIASFGAETSNSIGFRLGVFSPSTTTNKIINARDTYLLNYTLGDIAVFNGTTNGIIKLASGNSNTIQLSLLTTGQLTLNNYTTTTSFTGTLVGLLGFDSSGNVLTIAPEVASQSGQTGKFLTTDGTNTSWATISGGNIYNTDGTLTGNRVVTLGLNNLTFDGSAGGDIIYSDATNIQLGSVTGTKFGTTSAEKLAFYGLSPIAQQTTSVTAGAFVQNSTNAVYQDSTFSGYTIGQIVEALRFLGLLA
jgi:hypothetical protein